MGSDILSGVNYYGVTEDFSNIEKFNIGYGRYLQQTDFDHASNSIVIGYSIAEKIFGKPGESSW